MMKLKILLLVLTLFAPALAGCTHDPATTETSSAPTKVQKPFFWKVTKAGRTSYLLGTVHVGVHAEGELPPSVWQTFRRLTCFVMEADQEAVKPDLLLQMASLPPDQDLAKQLTPAVWKKVETKLAPIVGEAVLHRVRPWFVAILYLQTVVPKGEPMDGALLRLAKQGGKRIDYLEDWREAISAFAAVTEVSDLEDLVTHEEQAVKETDALLGAYRSGDEGQLTRVMKEINTRGQDSDRKMKALIQDRNVKWMPRLRETIEKQDCFVAVGAGHLVGDQNLRSLLAAEGYEVKRESAEAPLP